jgi:hypothetical protein
MEESLKIKNELICSPTVNISLHILPARIKI